MNILVAQYKKKLLGRGQEEIIPVRQHQEHSLMKDYTTCNCAEANTFLMQSWALEWQPGLERKKLNPRLSGVFHFFH